MQPLRMLEPHSYCYCDMCACLFFPRRIFIFSPKSHNWLCRCLIERNNYELRFVVFSFKLSFLNHLWPSLPICKCSKYHTIRVQKINIASGQAQAQISTVFKKCECVLRVLSTTRLVMYRRKEFKFGVRNRKS